MYDLKKLQKVEVEILDYIVNICNKNGLQYCLIYGTALGAVRHSGFIPWDDDIDIGMPAGDYELLKKIIQNDVGSKYIFQDMYNEQNYYMIFGKVRKKDTLFIESIEEKKLSQNGIFVDVFPLYAANKKNNIKTKYINYLKHLVKFSTHKKLYREKYSFAKYALSCLMSIPAIVRTPKNLLFDLDRFIKKTVDQNGKLLAEYDEKPKIQLIDADIYFPCKQMLFEGKIYNVPGRTNEYLNIVYGSNYMQLPPENERRTHLADKVEFEI